MSRQPDRLFGDWDASGHKRHQDDIIQGLVPGDLTACSFTDEGVRTMSADLSTTAERVWNANTMT